MTIELSNETKDLLERAMARGGFKSAEQLIQYSLSRTLSEADLFEDEAFVERVKAALKRSRADVQAGRVVSADGDAHAAVYAGVKRRAEERAARSSR